MTSYYFGKSVDGWNSFWKLSYNLKTCRDLRNTHKKHFVFSFSFIFFNNEIHNKMTKVHIVCFSLYQRKKIRYRCKYECRTCKKMSYNKANKSCCFLKNTDAFTLNQEKNWVFLKGLNATVPGLSNFPLFICYHVTRKKRISLTTFYLNNWCNITPFKNELVRINAGNK